MNTCIEGIKRMLAGHEYDLTELLNTAEYWERMTHAEFRELVEERYARNLHAPHSLESERSATRERYEKILRWIEDANMVLAVWYASAAEEG